MLFLFIYPFPFDHQWFCFDFLLYFIHISIEIHHAFDFSRLILFDQNQKRDFHSLSFSVYLPNFHSFKHENFIWKKNPFHILCANSPRKKSQMLIQWVRKPNKNSRKANKSQWKMNKTKKQNPAVDKMRVQIFGSKYWSHIKIKSIIKTFQKCGINNEYKYTHIMHKHKKICSEISTHRMTNWIPISVVTPILGLLQNYQINHYFLFQ